MLKKSFLLFATFAMAMFAIRVLLYYINHGTVTTYEIVHILKSLVLIGVEIVPLQYFLEKKK